MEKYYSATEILMKNGGAGESKPAPSHPYQVMYGQSCGEDEASGQQREDLRESGGKICLPLESPEYGDVVDRDAADKVDQKTPEKQKEFDPDHLLQVSGHHAVFVWQEDHFTLLLLEEKSAVEKGKRTAQSHKGKEETEFNGRRRPLGIGGNLAADAEKTEKVPEDQRGIEGKAFQLLFFKSIIVHSKSPFCASPRRSRMWGGFFLPREA